jgi:hypothetical protein
VSEVAEAMVGRLVEAINTAKEDTAADGLFAPGAAGG